MFWRYVCFKLKLFEITFCFKQAQFLFLRVKIRFTHVSKLRAISFKMNTKKKLKPGFNLVGQVIPRGNQARMKEQIESLTRWGRLSPLWRNERLLSVRVTISSLCARGWQERVATASPLLKTFSTRLVQTMSHVLALFPTEGLNHRKMLYSKFSCIYYNTT